MSSPPASRDGSQARMGYGKVTEVLDEGDESSALPNVLLAAQQHSQLVEKAGGKGSWTRQANWYVQDWQ